MELARPEVAPRYRGARPIFLLLLALGVAVAALLLTLHRRGDDAGAATGNDWWSQHKAQCNPVEVATALDASAPAPYRAACLAFAGKIDAARAVLLGVPDAERDEAVGFVFSVAHPIADMGDDASAGPIMELVVELQPNQYMALYHAGMAKAIAAEDAKARDFLTRFLQIYQADDGWTGNARAALRSLERPRSERTVKQSSEGSIIY